jgi:hypothetical protein
MAGGGSAGLNPALGVVLTLEGRTNSKQSGSDDKQHSERAAQAR